jgi:1-acyl-sn-glycerol-3-phosphate acyltransferase
MPSLFRGTFGRSLRSFQVQIVEAVFRVLFVYSCRGQEHIPATGPAVVASNHPSYLDPVLLSLRVRRPIRFMAWEGLFKVPVLGFIVRSFGAFPVNPARGKGREAYDRAKALVSAGKVVGIFPEGKRSRTSRMEPTLREGAARLAWETGAPLIPATITGAYRAWPHFRAVPKPAHVRVRFHRPIDPRAYRGLAENEALESMLVEWRRRVDRSLMPGAKADERIVTLYARRAPLPRFHEILLVVAVSALTFFGGGSWMFLFMPALYLAYLVADRLVIPQRRLVKCLRNTSPLLFVLAFGGVVQEALGLPPVPAGRALAAVLVGALVPYFYERLTIGLGFIRGIVFASLLELAASYAAPSALGPQVALPLFASGYAALNRTVFWRYSTPFLALYAFGATAYMGGGNELIAHIGAGLAALGLTRLWPYRLARDGRARDSKDAGVGSGEPPLSEQRAESGTRP